MNALLSIAAVMVVYAAIAALWLRASPRADELGILAVAAVAAWDAREAAGARMQHAAFYGPDTDVWSEADEANSDSWAEAEDALTEAMNEIREATR